MSVLTLRRYKLTYVYYPAQRSDSVCPVQYITPNSCVLHDTARDHDNILSSIRQFLDNQVHHLPQRRIFVLKQLGDAEEERGGFVRREPLPSE